MIDSRDKHILHNISITSLGGLLSRILGMLRDSATAALLGMSVDGVMDAFIAAFRIPDLFRRFFGEGIATASFVPKLAQRLEEDRETAWRLTAAVLLSAIGSGCVLVLLGEAICLGGIRLQPEELAWRLGVALAPYVGCVWLLAPLAAGLQTLGRFGPPALATCLLNLVWLIAAIWLAPWATSNRADQAWVLSCAIVGGGLLQVVSLMWMLRVAGYRWLRPTQASWSDVADILGTMGPAALGLAATQINIAMDGLTAWWLTYESTGSQAVQHGLSVGAAAATYFGERLFTFPLGLIGVAAASVLFPRLSRHASRGEWEQVDRDVAAGLKFVALLAVPSAVGLWIFAEPVTRLLFERGAFGPDDTARAARVVQAYGASVWAAASLPLAARACYAVNNCTVPAISGAVAIAANLILNLTLVGRWGEQGLAAATSASCVVQLTILLGWLAVRSEGRCLRGWLTMMLACSALAGGMAVAAAPLAAWSGQAAGWLLALRLAGSITACVVLYLAAAWACGVLRAAKPGADLRSNSRPGGPKPF